jgi:hypothetical protein
MDFITLRLSVTPVAALLDLKQFSVSLIAGKRMDKSHNLLFEPYHARESDFDTFR